MLNLCKYRSQWAPKLPCACANQFLSFWPHNLSMIFWKSSTLYAFGSSWWNPILFILNHHHCLWKFQLARGSPHDRSSLTFSTPLHHSARFGDLSPNHPSWLFSQSRLEELWSGGPETPLINYKQNHEWECSCSLLDPLGPCFVEY